MLCQHHTGTHQLVVYVPICRYPVYVLNGLGQLSGATGEDAVQRVSQLLYLSTLIHLYLQNSKDLNKRGEHALYCVSVKRVNPPYCVAGTTIL